MGISKFLADLQMTISLLPVTLTSLISLGTYLGFST